ncbi:hypothetical protein KJ359_009796 [Pestalotiopsis sp. 9143b]|nr:hypothetical protein KJ359_009796 [Pestalotiopsis sp. 9143b]
MAVVAAPNAFPPDEICNYTNGPAESPELKRGMKCEGCWKRTVNHQRCNPEYCDRTSFRGLVYREVQGIDFYGYWIKLGAGRGPMGREDRDLTGHWSEWIVPDNYHIEYALYKYWKNNWLDHWNGPMPLTWGTPEIPRPQGRIYIGPPSGKAEPEPLTWYRPLHAPSDPKSGYPKGDPLPAAGQEAARAEWRAVAQPAQPVPNRPCPLSRGHLYDAAPAAPVAGASADAPQSGYAPVDPAAGATGGYVYPDPAASGGYGGAGAAGGYGGAGAAGGYVYPDPAALGGYGGAGVAGGYGGAGAAGGYGAAASGLGLYRPFQAADPNPAAGVAGGAGSLIANPFTGYGLGGPVGLTMPDPRNNKRPGSPARERPGVKKPKPAGNNSVRDDPVYQLLNWDANNQNNGDVDMMEEDELHHNENNPVVRAGSSPPHMHGGAEPPRRVYDLEHESDVLALMDAALPQSVFSPAQERSPTPLPEMRDAAGNILSPLSALIASGPPLDPNSMTPFLDMLPRDVPGATGLPLPPLAPRVLPQLLSGRPPTTPEEAIARNEALYRPHEPRMRGLWDAQTFNRDVDFRSVASQGYHDMIARALNPRGEQIRGTAAPVARPASPGPTIPLFTGPRGEVPDDHPFERAGGRGAMPNIHRVRAWGEDAVTRGISAGLCACNQYTHGICESEEHHPGVPHYVCADCDNKSRSALKALFLEVNFINRIKVYACAQCTAGFILNPMCLHGSGQEVYEAAVDEDAESYPSYDPRVMKNNHRAGEGTVIRGGIYPGNRFTGCACAEKLLGRRLCNPHRTQAWIDCLDRMYDMASYKAGKFGEEDLCWYCLENPPLRPGQDQDLAGLVWGCIICSGYCVGMNPADLVVYSDRDNYPLVADAPPGERVRLLTPEEEAAEAAANNNEGLDADGDVPMS